MHHARGKNKSVTTYGHQAATRNMSFYYVISKRISADSLWSIVCNYNQVHKFALNIMTVFFLNNQLDAPIIQIYSVIKVYVFHASSLPIISFLLYIRRW